MVGILSSKTRRIRILNSMSLQEQIVEVRMLSSFCCLRKISISCQYSKEPIII